MTVDPKVYDLAVVWLSADECTNRKAHDVRVQSLAEAIQGAIEDWQEDETRAALEREAQLDELRSLKGYDPQDVAEHF
jgi:hypothetical protein